jgi:hypothetical protein
LFMDTTILKEIAKGKAQVGWTITWQGHCHVLKNKQILWEQQHTSLDQLCFVLHMDVNFQLLLLDNFQYLVDQLTAI